MNVHALPDLQLLDARSALEALTTRARALGSFGKDIVFDEPIWDLSNVKRAVPSAAQTARLFFTRHTLRETRSMEGREAFRTDFANLIKSLIVLRELSRKSGPDIYKKLLQASRHLYETLSDRDFDPGSITSEDFVAAATAISKQEGATRKSQGDRLEEIAAFINKHGLSRFRISFRSNVVRMERDNRTSDSAKLARAKKLPSEEVIDAVIAMSNEVRNNGDDADILRASVIEVMLSAPWRINELLSGPHDCLRKGQKTDPQTGERSDAYGLNHLGSKGADDDVKWFPTPMVDVALRALDDIRRITQPARNIAEWMEAHPGRAHLAEPWRLGDPEMYLTMKDVADALGLASKEAATYWLAAHKVDRFKRDHRFWCRLADLEAAVVASQPVLAPGSPPLSKYLFLVPDHFFRTDMATVHPIIKVVGIAQIHCFLSTAGKHKSVFERLGIADAEERPYVVTTKAFRHYLNTIAQEGCLPQLDIARWSGRKRVEQNAAYNHTGGVHLGKQLRSMLDTGHVDGPIAATVDALPLADRDRFLKSRFATAHTTDIGVCIQDWSMAPCPSHGACAGCGDHLVIKGNETHKGRAERLLVEHETMLALAKAEMDYGNSGAGPWVEHTEKMVNGLKKTIAVHADPDTPDGTLVQV
ncbi:MAG: hypothetical protein HZA66_10540 [Rhodopseudomonas palustris]|uniref:Integrase n=1 Tax=Rhodopseudomonas palustris TaxID=1076 RepID=A0A933RX78_RHOPL|nr:hypothetical protein [Rhodopseudomonas palustris]